MDINNLIPIEKREEIEKEYFKFGDFIEELCDSNSDIHGFFSTPAVIHLEPYHIYLETGVLDLDDTWSIADFITQLINLYVEQKYDSKALTEKQISLLEIVLNPELYRLQSTDLEKAVELIRKPFDTEKALALRVRRMMLFLSYAVEPVKGAKSLLQEKVQLRDKPNELYEGTYEGSRIDNEYPGGFYEMSKKGSRFKGPYRVAKMCFENLKKDAAKLVDLAIKALQLTDAAYFGQKTNKYLKQRLRNFDKWEKERVPAEAFTERNVSPETRKKIPFGYKPILKRLTNEKSEEYIVLYYFSEDWKKKPKQYKR